MAARGTLTKNAQNKLDTMHETLQRRHRPAQQIPRGHKGASTDQRRMSQRAPGISWQRAAAIIVVHVSCIYVDDKNMYSAVL